MSVVIRSVAIAPMLTLAGGVAVAAGIGEATRLPVNIKWPNDIVVRDDRAPGKRRKLAGILAEASTGERGVQHVVLGIGINVRPAAYPPELAARVTSLEHELGRPVDAGLVLSEVLVGLNEQVAALEAGRRDQVLARWRQLAPAASGASVTWNERGATMRGTTAGIDPDGALLIRTGSEVRRVISGEVIWE
jgi:BirA family biotin operon repressor/biotin-[acetyl-CoA-carboxylase] ligase